MKDWILVVDDNLQIRHTVGEILTKAGMRVTALKSGTVFLEYMETNQPDLVLLDIEMPGLDGYETLRRLRVLEAKNDRLNVPVIFLTARVEEDDELKGLSLGAKDYIKKPILPHVLTLRVRNTLELVRLQQHLEDEVERKTQQYDRLSLHIVETLAEAIDAKDHYTKGHSGRVAEYAREIAGRCGYSKEQQHKIYMMGLLHDVGKIGVPDAVINKPGRLTEEEFELIKLHPALGGSILSKIEEMPELSIGARWHHERFDGTGYPDGLKGTEIPEEARIIAVADAYDAMTSRRSYRDHLTQDAVREELKNGSGTQFDPAFAQIMLEMMEEDTTYKMKEHL